MKYKLFIILFFCIILNSFNTISLDTYGLEGYWSFDTNADDDHRGLYNGTVTGATNTASGCQSGNCYDFDGSGDYITFTDPVIGTGNKTICAYIQHDNDVDFDVIITNTVGTGSGDDGFTMATYDDTGKVFQMKAGNGAGAGEYLQHIGSVDDYNLNYYCLDMVSYLADTNLTMYEDGVIDGSDTSVAGVETAPDENLRLGSSSLATFEFEGTIDELTIWNRTLTTAEIQELDSLNGIPVDSGDPIYTLTINTDLINNTINYNFDSLNISYNGTLGGDNTLDLFNCTLYDNISFLTNATNVNLTINNNIQYNFTVEETIYNFNLYCENNETNSTTIHYIYNVDTRQPRINISGIIDEQQFTLLDNLNYSVNFTDTNLFAYNVTILDENNNIWNSNQYFLENITQDSIINSSFISLSESGNYSFIVEAWDSHTKKEIGDYKIKDLSNGVEIEDTIKLFSNDIKKIELNKHKDRYGFYVEFNDDKLQQTIKLESTSKLYFISKSNYKLHFVDFQNKKWIDFESDTPFNYIVEKERYNKYNITFIYEEKTKEIIYNSIGDLNYNNVTFTYTVITPIAEDLAVLISINETLNNINETSNSINNLTSLLEEGMTMLWLIILIIACVVMSIVFKMPFFAMFGGFGFILVFFSRLARGIVTDYDLILTISSFIIGFTFIIGGFIFQMKQWGEATKTTKAKGRLKRIYN